MMRGLILWVGFLTRIPVPSRVAFDEDVFVRGLVTAPLVGLLAGGVAAGAYALAALLGRPLLPPLAALAAGVAVTGALHLDGLADTADGLFSGRPREAMLAIMRDSRIGATGTVALVLVLLAKLVFLMSLSPGSAWRSIIAAAVLGRMAIAWCAGFAPYARDERGMGRRLAEHATPMHAVAATLVALPALVGLCRWAAGPALLAAVLTALLVTLIARRAIGGVTGDVMGAVVELSEAAALLALVVAGGAA